MAREAASCRRLRLGRRTRHRQRGARAGRGAGSGAAGHSSRGKRLKGPRKDPARGRSKLGSKTQRAGVFGVFCHASPGPGAAQLLPLRRGRRRKKRCDPPGRRGAPGSGWPCEGRRPWFLWMHRRSNNFPATPRAPGWPGVPRTRRRHRRAPHRTPGWPNARRRVRRPWPKTPVAGDGGAPRPPGNKPVRRSALFTLGWRRRWGNPGVRDPGFAEGTVRNGWTQPRTKERNKHSAINPYFG